MTKTISVDQTDIWVLLNKIFIGDSAPLTKSQYIDKITSDKSFLPDIQLWLDVLRTTCEDWINYKNSPTLENFKLVRDVDTWAFKDCFTINRLCEAIFLAFKIEPDIFKSKFRQWLEKERYFPQAPLPNGPLFEFTIEEPKEVDFYYDINSTGSKNS